MISIGPKIEQPEMVEQLIAVPEPGRCWGWATKQGSANYTMGFMTRQDALIDARETIGSGQEVWLARGRLAEKDDQDAPPEAMEFDRWYFAEDEKKART